MHFVFQPTLRGELLELRPLRAGDFRDLFQVAADPLIWEQHPNKNRHEEEVFKIFFREALDSGGALVAVDSKENRIIGSSRFHGYDEEKSEIEIGWTFLARSYWGGSYNGEMKRLMLRHAFKFVETVIFIINSQNVRSQRAVEKIGGIHTGSRRDVDGRTNFVYRITASMLEAKEIVKLVSAFESCTLPCEDWNHRAHLTVALWYLSKFSKDEATNLIREGIKKYNRACGVPNSNDRGYHETVTLFYVWQIHKYLSEAPKEFSIAELANDLIENHGDKNLPLQYYSRERLMLREARTDWVEPDLRRLD